LQDTAALHCGTRVCAGAMPVDSPLPHLVLQQAFSAVKAEMRELLAQHHVPQMTMKPVRREYAFENHTVPHGKQWVLKVRRHVIVGPRWAVA